MAVIFFHIILRIFICRRSLRLFILSPSFLPSTSYILTRSLTHSSPPLLQRSCEFLLNEAGELLLSYPVLTSN